MIFFVGYSELVGLAFDSLVCNTTRLTFPCGCIWELSRWRFLCKNVPS